MANTASDSVMLSRPPMAVDDLVHAYQQRVRDAVAACGVASADVDAVAQEVFVVVCRPEHRVPSSTETGAWMVGIARRLARNHLRRTARRRWVPFAHEPLAPPAWAAATTDEAELDALRRCLDALAPSQRALVLDYYAERRSASDLGRGLGVGADTVRHRLHRLRLRLADCIRRRLATRLGTGGVA